MNEHPSPAPISVSDTKSVSDFAQQAERPPRNFLVELLIDFGSFLREEKKWWLIPILVALVVIAAMAILLNSPAAPFIYPLF